MLGTGHKENKVSAHSTNVETARMATDPTSSSKTTYKNKIAADRASIKHIQELYKTSTDTANPRPKPIRNKTTSHSRNSKTLSRAYKK